MDEEVPGLSAYGSDPASGWGQGYGTSGGQAPDAALGASPSQVPGTSGAPQSTPSATPGGVSTGSPGQSPASLAGGQSSPWGSLAGLFGLNAPQSAAGAMKPGQGQKIAQLGMRMLAPPASPLRQGQPAPTLSTAGQNPQVVQFQQMFGVDYQTALAMMQMMHPGGTAMTPQQQAQNVYGGAAFQAPPATPPPSSLLPASSLPTAASPYGAPRMGMATPGALSSNLPPLGQGAFPNVSQPASLASQTLYGMPQMAEGGRPTGPTIVGERGPEVFVPDMPGSIVPMSRNDTPYGLYGRVPLPSWLSRPSSASSGGDVPYGLYRGLR